MSTRPKSRCFFFKKNYRLRSPDTLRILSASTGMAVATPNYFESHGLRGAEGRNPQGPIACDVQCTGPESS